MSEEKKPYLIINEECDEIQINIKHTKPYMKLQQENQQLKEQVQDLQEKVILLRASEPMLELEKYYGDRDKYKEVIEEVSEIIKTAVPKNNGDYMMVHDGNYKKLLQILDKANEK